MNNKVFRAFHEMRKEIKGPDGKLYYGWWNVFATYPCIIFIFTTPLMMLKLIYPAVEESLQISRADVVAISSVKFATSAIVAFAAGFLIDRLGVKSVLYLCAMVTGLGLVYFNFIDSKWTYWAAGIAMGFSSMPLLMATKTLVARWFNRRLGLAVGLTMSASSLAGIVFPILFAWMIETLGWQLATAWTSTGIFFIVMPVIYFVVRDNPSPEEIAAEFEGQGAAGKIVRGGLVEAETDEKDPSVGELFRKPTFMIIGFMMIAIGFVDQGFTQNLTPFLVNDLGFTLTKVAVTLSLSFLFGLSSKLFFGWLFDRLSFKGLSICYVMNALAIIAALGIQGFVTLLIFQLARGFAHSGILLETPVLAKHAFGPFHLGKVIGTFSALAGVGLTLGPIAVAKLFEIYGNYNVAFTLLTAIMALCAVIIYFLPPEYRLRQLREQKEREEQTVRSREYANETS